MNKNKILQFGTGILVLSGLHFALNKNIEDKSIEFLSKRLSCTKNSVEKVIEQADISAQSIGANLQAKANKQGDSIIFENISSNMFPWDKKDLQAFLQKEENINKTLWEILKKES